MNTVTFPPLAISLVALVLIFARGRCLVATGQKIRAAEDAISGFGGTQNPCRENLKSGFPRHGFCVPLPQMTGRKSKSVAKPVVR